jgi:hypothetical protein
MECMYTPDRLKNAFVNRRIPASINILSCSRLTRISSATIHLRTDRTGFRIDPGELTDEQRKALEHILASRDVVMDVSGIAGAGKSRLLKGVEVAAISVRKSIAILSPTHASVKDLRNAGFQVQRLAAS